MRKANESHACSARSIVETALEKGGSGTNATRSHPQESAKAGDSCGLSPPQKGQSLKG